MLRFLLDTDHLTLLQHHHPPLLRRLAAWPLNAVGISPVTAEESLRGRLAAVARASDAATRILQYGQLVEAIRLVGQLEIAPYDLSAENHFQQLRAQRLWVGTQDLRIAAVALANNLTLLTRNRRDFGRVPGLVLDDWSV